MEFTFFDELELNQSPLTVNLYSSPELQLRLKSEVSETEERKNAQIEEIRKKNEKAFTEIKNYYNDITLNNLAMIRYILTLGSQIFILWIRRICNHWQFDYFLRSLFELKKLTIS